MVVELHAGAARRAAAEQHRQAVGTEALRIARVQLRPQRVAHPAHRRAQVDGTVAIHRLLREGVHDAAAAVAVLRAVGQVDLGPVLERIGRGRAAEDAGLRQAFAQRFEQVRRGRGAARAVDALAAALHEHDDAIERLADRRGMDAERVGAAVTAARAPLVGVEHDLRRDTSRRQRDRGTRSARERQRRGAAVRGRHQALALIRGALREDRRAQRDQRRQVGAAPRDRARDARLLRGDARGDRRRVAAAPRVRRLQARAALPVRVVDHRAALVEGVVEAGLAGRVGGGACRRLRAAERARREAHRLADAGLLQAVDEASGRERRRVARGRDGGAVGAVAQDVALELREARADLRVGVGAQGAGRLDALQVLAGDRVAAGAQLARGALLADEAWRGRCL